MISFDPLIPSSLLLALILCGSGLLAWYALRRPGSMAPARWGLSLVLMAGSFLGVVVILLNPTLVYRSPPPAGKPGLTILLDDSLSMGTPDAGGGATRCEAARGLAATLARRLDDRFEVRIRSFGSVIKPLTREELASLKPQGQSTNLAQALSDSLAEDRPQGQAVVLLSDGIHNAPGSRDRVLDAVRFARASTAPIYTRAYGGQTLAADLSVELRLPQELAFVNQKVPVTATVSCQGVTAVTATVVLLHQNREMARREMVLRPQSSADVSFMVSQEKVGLYPYEVKVQPLAGEVAQNNNAASYLLRVVDEPIRVLVLEGKPYWDAKFLLRTLGADQAISLDSVVKMADSRFLRRTLSRSQTTTAPAGGSGGRTETWKIINDAAQVLASPDALRVYQIVVLGRDSEIFLTDGAISNLQAWIARDGGSLVCYRGTPTAQVHQRLARLMPVKWSNSRESRFHVQLTEQGREMRWLPTSEAADLLARMPSLAQDARVDQSKPLAVVLATSVGADGQSAPVVVYQPYGSGRVVVLEGAGMWRWAFLPPQYQDQQNVYANLWHSLLRWMISSSNLLPGQTMTLRGDKLTFSTDESATVTLLIKEERRAVELPKIELVSGGDQGGKMFAPAPVGDEPGVYRVDFGRLAEGRYQARIAGEAQAADPLTGRDPSHETLFDVRPLSDEQINLVARPDLMARIATDSGGAVLGANAVEDVRSGFDQYMQRARPPQVQRLTAWDRWWILAAVLGLWTATWVVRRSGGLI